MGSLEKVVLVGATGNLGPSILGALREGGFQVTVLTRKESRHTFPQDVTVKPVDYSSVEELTDALRGQDAVVSNIGAAGTALQPRFMEAAIAAGVKRFIPSEFGSNTLHAKTAQLPVFGDKVATRKALEQAAGEGRLTYTIICNGLFLDWAIEHGFIMNLEQKSIDLYDGGDSVFSTSRLATVGRAVAGVLRHPEETRNRAVYVHDTAVTLKQLAAMGKAATGGPEGWKEEHVPLSRVLDEAWAELKKEAPNPEAFAIRFIKVAVWGGDEYGAHFKKTDNELLGIKEMTDAEVQELVNSYV